MIRLDNIIPDLPFTSLKTYLQEFIYQQRLFQESFSKQLENLNIRFKISPPVIESNLLHLNEAIKQVFQSIDVNLNIPITELRKSLSVINEIPTYYNANSEAVHVKNEITAKLEEVISNTFDEENIVDGYTFQHKLSQLLNGIGQVLIKINNPKLRNILNQVVVGLIVSILMHLAANVTDNIFGNDKSISEKQKVIVVKTTINNINIPNKYLSNHRYVTKDGLKVYDGKTVKSFVTDRLYIGKMVEIINKKKNWTFVSYLNSNREIKFGWVQTRYIKKF